MVKWSKVPANGNSYAGGPRRLCNLKLPPERSGHGVVFGCGRPSYLQCVLGRHFGFAMVGWYPGKKR